MSLRKNFFRGLFVPGLLAGSIVLAACTEARSWPVRVPDFGETIEREARRVLGNTVRIQLEGVTQGEEEIELTVYNETELSEIEDDRKWVIQSLKYSDRRDMSKVRFSSGRINGRPVAFVRPGAEALLAACLGENTDDWVGITLVDVEHIINTDTNPSGQMTRFAGISSCPAQ